jgi:hypothetical protein
LFLRGDLARDQHQGEMEGEDEKTICFDFRFDFIHTHFSHSRLRVHSFTTGDSEAKE